MEIVSNLIEIISVRQEPYTQIWEQKRTEHSLYVEIVADIASHS
jgi:hypothetical protein